VGLFEAVPGLLPMIYLTAKKDYERRSYSHELPKKALKRETITAGLGMVLK